MNKNLSSEKKRVASTAFGKIIKIKLIEQNMTQVELANKLGISRQYVCRIISGDRSGRKYIADIKRILNIDEVA